MLVLKFLLGLAFVLWILIYRNRRKYYKLMKQVPGPKGLPYFGPMHKIRCLEDIFTYTEELSKTYVSPIFIMAGPYNVFVICDSQNAQDVLTSPLCVNRSALYDPMRDVFGDGLLTLGNPEWSVHRKLLNPAFSYENLRSFVPIFNEKTKAFVKAFEVSNAKEAIDVLPMIQRLTMNMALETTMGLKANTGTSSYDDKTEEILFASYHNLADKIMTLVVMPWTRFEFVRKLLPSFKLYTTSKNELRKYFVKLIREKLEPSLTATNTTATISKNAVDADVFQKRQKHIFIDIALELLRSGKFSAQNVEDHANNMVFGAFETTATTITHAMILLAMNPKCQEIAFEEISALYTDRDNVTVTDEDLQHLVYMDMIINETMRLLPTVPFIGRTATSDVRLSSGVVLPQGTQIAIHLFYMHRYKNIWGPNALLFNPENFLPENIKNRHPYAFIPFTKGIRSCIGRRYGINATKIVLAILLRKYRLTTTSKFEDLRCEPAVSTRLINPPLLKFELREK